MNLGYNTTAITNNHMSLYFSSLSNLNSSEYPQIFAFLYFGSIVTQIQRIIFWSLTKPIYNVWAFLIDLVKTYGRLKNLYDLKSAQKAVFYSNSPPNLLRQLKFGHVGVLNLFPHIRQWMNFLSHFLYFQPLSKFEWTLSLRWIKNLKKCFFFPYLRKTCLTKFWEIFVHTPSATSWRKSWTLVILDPFGSKLKWSYFCSQLTPNT